MRPQRAGKRSGVTRVSRRPSPAPDTVRDVAWTAGSAAESAAGSAAWDEHNGALTRMLTSLAGAP